MVLRIKAARHCDLQIARGDRLPFLSNATVSCSGALQISEIVATDRMAMHSDPTAMPNFDCIMKPSDLTTDADMICEGSARKKSMIHPILHAGGLMSRRFILVSAPVARRYSCAHAAYGR